MGGYNAHPTLSTQISKHETFSRPRLQQVRNSCQTNFVQMIDIR